jgi:hypothetical protein
MIPRNETIKEVVNWMDKYWGEPSRVSQHATPW